MINPTMSGLLLYPEDVEKDDYLHNPDINDKDRRCEAFFSPRGLANVGGLIFLVLGTLFLFIGYPVITFFRSVIDPPGPCTGNALCIPGGDTSLLKNIRTGLIDSTTPSSAMTKLDPNGNTLKLVFSDEFNTPNRSLYSGDDPFWEAVDLWYGATQDLEYYDPDAITTRDGYLDIQFDAFENHNLAYRSGMLQSWNKLCIQGGTIEASISLPGVGGMSGFWPGFWTMGNLGRPGYTATTEGMWPYSYHDECDAGITANQSMTDGISSLPGMKLPACTCSGEDHPTPGKSRGAPEIDAIEASAAFLGPGVANPIGVASQSCQMAPFDIWYQPDYDYVAVYDEKITQINSYRGGVFQQAMSGISTLNNDWYDGAGYQSYGFFYEPGGADGTITWYVGEEKTWTMTGNSIGPNGNIGQRMITSEPMSMVINLGMGTSFAPVDFAQIASVLPAHMRIDYVRVYQNPDNEVVTCDPKGYETTEYIASHPTPYTNNNVTSW
jgi:beta-glucanase (GH16 family)